MFRTPHAWLNMLLRLLIGALLLAYVLPTALPSAAAKAPITVLTIEGPIGPASADYVVRGIAHAAKDGSALVILQIDTPGGLDLSMRSVIKAILNSPVPVASFVAPRGARAASAGTYIMYASHFAAMAPGTNLGAATPVQIAPPGIGGEPEKPAPRKDGEDRPAADKPAASKPALPTAPAPAGAPAAPAAGSAMEHKVINDAAAYLRGLAQMRGRNAEWGERSVREGLSLSAEDALKEHVVDYIATDVAALAARLDGAKVRVLDREIQLHTAGAPLVNIVPDFRSRLLTVITNPSIALILMSIGIYGLLFEFMSPGAVAPGVIGAICLLLALYGLQLLPVNYAGLALIILGIAFMIAEVFLPSFGVVGLGGVAAFIAGALILIDTERPEYGIPVGLIVFVAVISGLLIFATVGVALRSRRRAVVSGVDSLVGTIAQVLDDTPGVATPGDTPREGWANAGGETWRVESPVPLLRGQNVRIVRRRGSALEVIPLDNNDKGERT